MYAARNNYILCVETLLRLPDVNVKWRDNVHSLFERISRV